ncbi:uncharacterized protein LOC112086771 isoform X2 [Eutrema salsugineum]|uniref:uncharacterized protein LOC112086771 isoform X2 n=1 Tax=Eutrema salsugineum TaxID=72664 RepID=UPI000CED4C41|nr:uncharacterized protein LOC112086771 isoform X2 [Eutrema salsugineum]
MKVKAFLCHFHFCNLLSSLIQNDAASVFEATINEPNAFFGSSISAVLGQMTYFAAGEAASCVSVPVELRFLNRA